MSTSPTPSTNDFIIFFIKFVSTSPETLPKNYLQKFKDAKSSPTAYIFKKAGAIAWLAWLLARKLADGRNQTGKTEAARKLKILDGLSDDVKSKIANAVAITEVSTQVAKLARRSTTGRQTQALTDGNPGTVSPSPPITSTTSFSAEQTNPSAIHSLSTAPVTAAASASPSGFITRIPMDMQGLLSPSTTCPPIVQDWYEGPDTRASPKGARLSRVFPSLICKAILKYSSRTHLQMHMSRAGPSVTVGMCFDSSLARKVIKGLTGGRLENSEEGTWSLLCNESPGGMRFSGSGSGLVIHGIQMRAVLEVLGKQVHEAMCALLDMERGDRETTGTLLWISIPIKCDTLCSLSFLIERDKGWDICGELFGF